ncbi:MAG: mRNA surveillance protein pelota [Methanomicrobiales archaeon]|nr:mRNA surveillance protein pelota [Methanomicrobiales archaeon]
MRAEIGNLDRFFGEIKLTPESADDLWHLEHLITIRSLLFATTLRSVETASDKIRPDKQEKKPVRLGIRVEQVEFSEYATRLRIFGSIESGVDIGSHHTINLEPGYQVSVIRTWHKVDLERIERASKAGREEISILAIEEGEASLFQLRSYGPKEIFSIVKGSGKGADCDTRDEFYRLILDNLASLEGPLVIAGPGFIKEDLAQRYRRRFEDRKPPLVLETRRAGAGAVQEGIGLGAIDKLIGDMQLTSEIKTMDELLKRIAKDEPCAYGHHEVLKAIEYGATETVMLVDLLLREKKYTSLLEKAEQIGSDVVILSSRFEPGERLMALGGVSALLRYAI